MKLSDFDYSLPRELIAQSPLDVRDSSRLLVVDRIKNTIRHTRFSALANFLHPDDLLALNNTKVMPVRLVGFKKDTLGKVDILLSNRLSEKEFKALIKPHLKLGQEIIFTSPNANSGLKARLLDKQILEFDEPITLKILNRFGLMPLPPYIKRPVDREDLERYQTVYAKKLGSIASPTAGLHFTKEFLKKIEEKSVRIAYVTLHVGEATFRPVKCLDIREHKMEDEKFMVSAQALKLLNQTRENKKRILAAGTTTLRTLETIASMDKLPSKTINGRTNLFVYPGYKFKMVDCLLTNFHLPKTTLFMLVCAFAGRDLIIDAYQEAISRRYRFYSYGDAMLIL